MSHAPNPQHLPPAKSAEEYEREIARLHELNMDEYSKGFQAGVRLAKWILEPDTDDQRDTRLMQVRETHDN